MRMNKVWRPLLSVAAVQGELTAAQELQSHTQKQLTTQHTIDSFTLHSHQLHAIYSPPCQQLAILLYSDHHIPCTTLHNAIVVLLLKIIIVKLRYYDGIIIYRLNMYICDYLIFPILQ